MGNFLATRFPTAARVINAVRNVDPQPTNTNVVVRQPERPPVPSMPQMQDDLHEHPVMRGIHQIMAAHTIQQMDYLDRRLQELDRSDGINVNVSHYVDKRNIDNSYRADSRVDARRFTNIDSRRIEAKKRLHSDWGMVAIIIFLLGLAVIGTALKNSGG